MAEGDRNKPQNWEIKMQVGVKGYDSRRSESAVCVSMYNAEGKRVFDIIKLLNGNYAIRGCGKRKIVVKNDISWKEAMAFKANFGQRIVSYGR